MQRTIDGLRRALVGREVLGAVALLLVVSGMTTAGVFIHVGVAVAGTVQQVVPAVQGALFDVVILAALYLEAVVLGNAYRAVAGVYATLQRRAQRATSA